MSIVTQERMRLRQEIGGIWVLKRAVEFHNLTLCVRIPLEEGIMGMTPVGEMGLWEGLIRL